MATSSVMSASAIFILIKKWILQSLLQPANLGGEFCNFLPPPPPPPRHSYAYEQRGNGGSRYCMPFKNKTFVSESKFD